MMLFKTFLCILLSVAKHNALGTNDPELVEQLWNQLYRYLPRPAMAPQLGTELPINVDVSVSLDNVVLQHGDNGLLCRVSLTIFAEWPVTDERITESALIELAQGGLLLDINRVWHPELVITGSYSVQTVTRRVELRVNPESKSDASVANMAASKRVNQMGNNNKAVAASGHLKQLSQQQQQARQLLNDAPAQSMRPHSRSKTINMGGIIETPRFVLIENLIIDVGCAQPEKIGHIGAVNCPIWIRQEGSMQNQPKIKWTDRNGCLMTTEVNKKISNARLTKQFRKHVDLLGPDHNLRINLCFSQKTRLLQYSFLPVLLIISSLYILWNFPSRTGDSIWCQLVIVLFTIALWIWTGDKNAIHSSPEMNALDIWYILCFTLVTLSCLLTLLQDKWIESLFYHQQRFCMMRTPSISVLHNKTGGNGVASNVVGIPGCLQGCSCESSCGTCGDSVNNCNVIGGRNSSTFLQNNGPTTNCCGASSCGASGASVGHTCGPNATTNSPGPIGFSAQVYNAPKMDAYTEGLLCSTGSDVTNGGQTGTFRGLRWRTGFNRRSTNGNGNGVGTLGLEVPDGNCFHVCTCQLMTAQMMHQQIGPQPNQQQHQSGSPAPPYTSVCSSLSRGLPTNCYMKWCKILLTGISAVASTIFWIGILAQGTVPDECVGGFSCQPNIIEQV